MSKDKSEVVVLEKDLQKSADDTVIVTTSKSHQTSAEAGVSQQFLKLAKKLAIDGALLPEDNQMLIED